MLGLKYDEANRLIWTYLAGDYSSNYDSMGIPNNIQPNSQVKFSDDFLNKISVALPEGKDVRKTNPNYITDDTGANITLNDTAEVWITFLHEGAGFRNSFGFFTFTEDSIPKTKFEVSETVVFPNSSYHNSGGSQQGLRSGDTVSIGIFPAGTKIGFFVVSDGFDRHRNDGVRKSADINRIFYTLKDLNSESDPELRAHTVLLNDTVFGVVLGMEDIIRTSTNCDHDFNDIMFTVTSNPIDAIDTTFLIPLPEPLDRDGDGVLDANDDFPDDPKRAFNTYYPSRTSWGTLAFEDNWPEQGDYDMNDLVLNYRFTQVLDASLKIKDIKIDIKIAGRGAAYKNGFGIEFIGVNSSNVEQAWLRKNSNDTNTISAETGQDNLVYIFFDDATEHSPAPEGWGFFNTEKGSPTGSSDTFQLVITFENSINKNSIGSPPYNPFIFRKNNRGLEIHLPDKPPTSKADIALFGTGDDDSNISAGRYYKTRKNLPWAIDIPFKWSYPSEMSVILNAYPDFKKWAESGGTLNKDWYLTNSNPNYIY